MAKNKAAKQSRQDQVTFNPNAYTLHKKSVPGTSGVGARAKSTKND